MLRALAYEGLVKISGFIKAEVAPSRTLRFTLNLVIILINNVVSYLPDRIFFVTPYRTGYTTEVSFFFLLSYLNR